MKRRVQNLYAGRHVSLLRLAVGLAFLLSLMEQSAYGKARPAWVETTPREDSQYRYYVGRAADSPNESMAFSEATRDAYEEAIRENFGVRMQIDTQAYEGSEKSASTKYIEMLSRRVELHGFEQADSYREEGSGNRLNLWVLYRYAKFEISKEHVRLRRVKEAEEKPPAFSDIGDTSNSEGGTLEVVTIPPGASVLIDGTPSGFAKTPLRLSGSLFAPGQHRIRVDHPNFEPLEETVITLPGRRVRIERRLVPATGTLRVITTPPNANVLIGGRPAGTSPTNEINVPAGRPLLIEVSHAEAEKLIQEVVVSRKESRELFLKLPLKPSFLSVVSDPPNAELQIDDKHFSTPTGKIRLEAGGHHIRITKYGYEDYDASIELHGGEERVLPTITLSHVEPRELYLLDPSWKVVINPYQLNTTTLQNPAYPFSASGVSVEYNFLSWVGISLDSDLVLGSSTYSNGNVSLTGLRFTVGLPISFRFLPCIFVRPEWIWLYSHYTVHYSTDGSDTTTSASSQFLYGLSVGAIFWVNDARESSFRWGFTGKVGAAIPYQNPSGFQGQTSWNAGLGVLFGF